MIPRIDPNVQFVGAAKLRELSTERLRALDKTLVIQADDKPLAVLMTYEIFMATQEQLRSTKTP